MLKRSVSVLLFLLSLTVGTSVFAAETDNENVEKALRIIDETNAVIDAEIVQAQNSAGVLQDAYFADIQSIEGTEAIIALRSELINLEKALKFATEESEIASLSEQVATLTAEVTSLEAVLSEQSSEFAELTLTYNESLNLIIHDVDVLTRELSAEGIAKAAELGVKAECVWKYVNFAHKWAWIDPIQVVGS
ncbi:hypothetical protein [Bacillus cihuensis]|uniref:hypothetical protein n=1 Tax=Bacillus cihuensis TaxID=1208599 RepID=UPI00041DCC4A|nr:hypothetical protein [Bacillus cihuensis]